MSFLSSEDDGLRAVWGAKDELCHLPLLAACESEGNTLTCCGQWGPVIMYGATSYELGASDFCPACVISQELERVAIAAAKARPSAGSETGWCFSDSPDILYVTLMDEAETTYWMAVADQLGALNRDAGGNGVGLLAWLKGEHNQHEQFGE